MKKGYLLLLLSMLLLVNTSIAQVYGCTDPMATNYNTSATSNDGSCTYNPVSVAPTASFNLSAEIPETSGLIKWNNYIWTFNDSFDLNIYALDTSNGAVIHPYPLSGMINTDWEEISQDDQYVYIGDFGNNATGNRTDLHILKIDKNSILANSPLIETINFSYSNQTNFTSAGSNNTDFDCEAFVVSADSIYLFTKQWISQKTSIYSLPKVPGTYVAKLKSTFNVQGLVTGATYLELKKMVVLSGYSKFLQPFVYVLYDYKGTDFAGGNKRKIEVSLPFHQVEGIATADGLKYYISNEKFIQQPINIPQKLHILDLSEYLGPYVNNLYTYTESIESGSDLLFPNPAGNFITFRTNRYLYPSNYYIVDQKGQTAIKGTLKSGNQQISVSDLPAGTYLLKIGGNSMQSFKMIKR